MSKKQKEEIAVLEAKGSKRTKLEEELFVAMQRQEKAANRVTQLKQQERSKKSKLDTHKKIVLGGHLLTLFEKDKQLEKKVLSELDRVLHPVKKRYSRIALGLSVPAEAAPDG